MADMILEPETYFRQLVSERDPFLKELEREAKDHEIPIIGPIVGELLYILVKATGATSLLELGTAAGYSGIYLARAAAENGGRLLTIEWSPEMAKRAARNFEKAGVSHAVEIRVGDALQILDLLKGSFDFAFLDIDKEFYQRILPLIRGVMKQSGILVADNVAFKDADAFNQAIARSNDWKSVNLFAFLPGHSPEKDGLCFAIVR